MPKIKSRAVYLGYMNGRLDTPLINEFVDSDSDATDWSNAELIGSHVAQPCESAFALNMFGIS